MTLSITKLPLTKAELLAAIADAPDDAEVYVVRHGLAVSEGLTVSFQDDGDYLEPIIYINMPDEDEEDRT